MLDWNQLPGKSMRRKLCELDHPKSSQYFESYEMPENSTGIHHSQPLYPDRGTGVCTRVPADSTYDSTH